MSEQEAIRKHDERIRVRPGNRGERVLEIGYSASVNRGLQRYAQRLGRDLRVLIKSVVRPIVRIPEHGNARHLWGCPLEKLQALAFQLPRSSAIPRDVPARLREARREAKRDRIADNRRDNRDSAGGL